MKYEESVIVPSEGAIVDRIVRVVEEALSRRENPGRLAIRMPNRQVFVPVNEIDWIESERNNVRVHSGSRSFAIRGTLSDLESRLPASGFVRVQRSSIVNVDRVEEIRKAGRDFEIVLRGGARIVLGRSYLNRLEQVLSEG